ncbi:MAG: 4Fe-4S binding protein [Actinobacteria bacterium]|nr:4Fe-4S binding protein [Actinomycetota bacterium]
MTTAVLLCGDGLPPDLRVGEARLVAGLCTRPEPVRELAAGATAVVLGLCDRRHSLGAVQREVRKAGLDPLGVEFVDLRDADGDVGRLETLLAGAAARAEAFPGSGPEHAKLVMGQTANRRALLTLALPEYHAAPAVDDGPCAAERGCRACVDACPQEALSLSGGRVLHNRSVCEPCGRCVTACPTGAVANPGVDPSAVAAQIRALLDPAVGAAGPRGIVFRCRRGNHPETDPGWLPVSVPCTGMLTPAWILAPLALGAAAVAVRPCDAVGCPLAHDELVVERVDWCQEFLDGAGGDAGRVSLVPDALPAEPLSIPAPANPFAPLGAAAVLAALSQASDQDVRVARAGSPLGIIDIDPVACTGCATCAQSCPAGALSVGGANGTRSITFDHARCIACGVCTGRCPESEAGAIRLTAAVETARLARGREVVWEGAVTSCESCGAPVATEALLARVGALLADDTVASAISRYCSHCRGVRL